MTNTERIQTNNAELREAIQMAENLPDAGGGAVVKPIIEPLEVTENGTYTAPDGVDGYSPVVVDVPIPDGYIVPSGTKDITENGTHDVKAYEAVSVDVPIPDGYLKPSGTLEVAENGTHDVAEYASVEVNVPSGGGYDEFWDLYQKSGKRSNYQSAFGGEGWNEQTFKPKYDILHTNDYPAYMIFRACGFKNLREAIEASGKSVTLSATTFQFVFQNSYSLEEVGGITFGVPLEIVTSAFQNCRKLKKIQTLPISENATTLDFTNIPVLEDISFSGVIPANISFAQSSNLSLDSVQSVIDHLKDLTGAAAKTLTLHATVGGKLTDEQKAAITAKNWTLVY